jgi:hypothetical protein
MPHTSRPREATQPDPVDPRHCAPPTPKRGRPWREREREREREIEEPDGGREALVTLLCGREGY